MPVEPTARHNEAELVARLQRGDDAAFEALVRDNSARLVALAQRILGDEDAARDAVQDAFLNAHRAIGRFNGEARLSTWLHRITVNSALAIVRRRRRHRELALEEVTAGSSELPAFDETSRRAHEDGAVPADAAIETRQERERVARWLAGLKEHHRRVLTLRYLDEYDTATTARILGVAPNTVKTRLLRARNALRERIDAEAHPHAAPSRRAA